VPKSAVRQTNSNKSNAIGRRLFCRVHIADVDAVIDTSLAVDSLSNTEVAAAVDVSTGSVAKGAAEVADGVVKKRTSTGGRVEVAFGVARKGERPLRSR